MDEGSYDENEIPENMKHWLQFFQNEIRRLGNAEIVVTANDDSKEAIDPMLTTRWDQIKPYNYQCHMGFINDYALTVCAATALAQEMNYHKWPKTTSEEIPAYTVNYSGHGAKGWEAQPVYSFDWESMKDSYSGSEDAADASVIAVSKLMRYCGQSLKMGYSNTSSSANSYLMTNALKKYFGYDNDLKLVKRSSYTIQGREDLIYNELKTNVLSFTVDSQQAVGMPLSVMVTTEKGSSISTGDGVAETMVSSVCR